MLALAHFTLGSATAVAVCQPKNISQAIPVGLIGGLFGIWPDCDLGDSKVSKLADNATKFIIPVLLLCYLIKREGVNIYHMEKFIKFFLGVGIFIGFTFFGRSRPHREFTHSLLCAVILSAGAYLMIPDLWQAVLVGTLSHIGIDLLNEKGETILFPIKKKFKLGICKSNGIVNSVLPIPCVAYLVIRIIILF